MRYIKMIWFVVFLVASSSAFSEEDMVEKAWACEPSLMPSYENLKYPGVSMNTKPSDILRFSEKCNELSEEDKNLLRKVLLNEYAVPSIGKWMLDSFKSAKRQRGEVEAAKARDENAKDREAKIEVASQFRTAR